MSKKRFKPTNEQRKMVLERLSKGELAQSIRLDIVNPETEKPLHIDTFCLIFEEEMINARGIRGTKVCSNLFAGAIAEQKNLVTGMFERDSKLIQQWLALDGRGLFGKKFKLDCKLPLKDQFITVKQACADGLIGSQEMSAFVDAIVKEMQLIEFQTMKTEFAELKEMLIGVHPR